MPYRSPFRAGGRAADGFARPLRRGQHRRRLGSFADVTNCRRAWQYLTATRSRKDVARRLDVVLARRLSAAQSRWLSVVVMRAFAGGCFSSERGHTVERLGDENRTAQCACQRRGCGDAGLATAQPASQGPAFSTALERFWRARLWLQQKTIEHCQRSGGLPPRGPLLDVSGRGASVCRAAGCC